VVPDVEDDDDVEPVLGTRRQARELALSLLYEADAKSVSPSAVLDEFPIDPDPFAADLVSGVAKHHDEIDGYIRRFAKDWSLERMPVVDRNLLRIGVYELVHRPDVPMAAVISEAVELARRYSTEESGRFVNGMLGRIADEVRPEP
jgi:N utilization substance protein B